MQLYTDGLKLRDEYGRQRIFRGENICIKEAKLSPAKLQKQLNIKFNKLHKAGFNIIRLGITWALIEPEENKYNQEIIDVLHGFVKRCEKTGVYVMPDMHQDLYSKRFYGDGMPAWAIDKKIKPKRFMAIWAEGYFYMDSVQQGFYDFWHNINHVQDKFIKMWKHFADCFADCDNVIGYDYLNEPYVESKGRKIFTSFVQNLVENIYSVKTDLSRHYEGKNDRQGFFSMVGEVSKIVLKHNGPLKMLEKMDDYTVFANAINGLEQYTTDFNKNYYQPFIDKCNKEISKGRLSFFEHNYYSNLGIKFSMDTEKNYVYSPHAYDLFVDSLLYNKYSSDNRIRFITDEIRKNQIEMNVPVLFGEWGCGADGNKWIDHIEYVMDIMEKHQWSNIYWNYRHENRDFCNRINRPYPIAVCGDITEYKTDSKNRTFTMTFVQYERLKNIDNIIYIPRKGLYRFKANPGKNKIKVKY